MASVERLHDFQRVRDLKNEAVRVGVRAVVRYYESGPQESLPCPDHDETFVTARRRAELASNQLDNEQRYWDAQE